MDRDDPFAMSDAVDSKRSFLEFLAALEASAQSDRNRWENGTIPDFLSACRRWAEATSSMTGRPMAAEEPTWSAFANILHAGKFYE